LKPEKKGYGIWAYATAAAITLACVAGAAVLDPGDTLFKPGEGLGTPVYDTTLPGYADADHLVASLVSSFTDAQPGGDNFVGTLSSFVYRNPDTDNLLFVYEAYVSDTATAELVRLTLNGYGGVEVSGAVGADGSGTSGTGDVSPEWTDGDPNFLLRNLLNNGDTIAAQFRTNFVGASLAPGDVSSLVFFETDASTWTEDSAQVLNGSTGICRALVPNVPAPGALALLVAGLAFVGKAASGRRSGCSQILRAKEGHARKEEV